MGGEVTDTAANPSAGHAKFARHHRSDHTFYVTYLVIIWLVMIGGFGLDIVRKFAKVGLHYPLIVHVHALVFTGWLVLFTTQVLLNGRGNNRLHRRLGVLALGFIPLMVVLGPATAIVVDRLKFGHPNTAFPVISAQFANVLASSVVLIAGLLLRAHPAAHKRLMLMGTLAMTEPGIARLIFKPLSAMMGKGVWPFFFADYGGSVLLMLGLGAYDMVTRGRLHPAYVAAFAWVLANEMTAAWLFNQPWWAVVTTHMLGHQSVMR